MSEASSPKTWKEAFSSHIVWGSLIFTCFLVFIEKVIEQHYGQALAAFILGLAIAAIALHSKTWLERTNPNWAYAGALAFVLAVVATPFVEQRRWPFAWQFTAPASPQTAALTQQEIDARIAAAIAKVNSQLVEANRQRDAARREVEELRSQARNASAPTPNHDEPRAYTNKTIAELRGFYRGRTALQGSAFMADEIGKWINTEGSIQFIRPDGLVFLSDEGGIISCEFDPSWNPKLGGFRAGETMKVRGKIGTAQIGPSPIYLRPCEIRD